MSAPAPPGIIRGVIVLDTITKSPVVQTLCRRAAASESIPDAPPPLAANGLWGSCAPLLAAALARELQRPLLYVTAHLQQADNARDDLETALGGEVELLPAWETLPGEGERADEIGEERARLCGLLRQAGTKRQTIDIRRSERQWQAAKTPKRQNFSASTRPTLDDGVGRRQGHTLESRRDAAEPKNHRIAKPLTSASAEVKGGSPNHPIIVAPIQALMQPVPGRAVLDANTLRLAVGERRSMDGIAEWLVGRGFERLDHVEQPGDFAIRGGILDIFASADADPVRVEFLGEEIESIRQFEIGSHRSTRDLVQTSITRAQPSASLAPGETTSFASYLPVDTLVVLHEPLEAAELARIVFERTNRPTGHDSFDAIDKKLSRFLRVYMSRFRLAAVADEDTVSVACDPLPAFDAKAADAIAQLLGMAETQHVVVYCDNQGERDRLRELIQQHSETSKRQNVETPKQDGETSERQTIDIRRSERQWHAVKTPKQENSAAESAAGASNGRLALDLEIGLIHEGFIWKDENAKTPKRQKVKTSKRQNAENVEEIAEAVDHQITKSPNHQIALVPHHQLFRRYTQWRRIRKAPAGRPIETFLDLEDGDYVVHVVHGIARFVGMKTMRKGDSRQSEEFLTLKFADDATMHVPASQIDLVQKYVGARALRPVLSKLGGTRWQATKQKVEEAVTDLAGDLLRIQACREAEPGIPYPQDTHWQKEFENAFLYTETPDQTMALGEIKSDQVRARPMDRLLCGDVGYGKTELAIRAAFKVAEFGRQVAVLVPTTVLADQHHRTFGERLADYPFNIECINRFRSTKEQREIIQAARKGQLDILIGTHRLLSKDVDFANLGLVIVDEEQRFGVEHKERLKKLRATVDVLTLTATPIPRTLHMAMVGLRDISSLATPPLDRRAIATRVCPWSDETIREGIIRELNRDGQVFFVHNRVRPIRRIAEKLQSLVPDARIVVGHGQMSGDELEDVMLRFVRHEADVLVCTTIIEAGLDIPNANTIFIDRADMFGLADLHQLRGRVGRYKHRAYCYLLLSPDRPLTNQAARRLKAIEQFSELGAGFRIAMRDLEIRGAGNILGPEQSGHIAAVGYELYCQLLDQTVKRMKGEPYKPRAAVHLELGYESYIPKAYIASDRQRMECYRRLAACRTPQDVEQLEKDLIDAFGPFPETVDTLLAMAEIRVRASAAGFKAIVKTEPDLIFTFDGEVKRIEPLFKGASGRVSLPDGRTVHWRLPDHYYHGRTLLAVLRNLFRRGASP